MEWTQEQRDAALEKLEEVTSQKGALKPAKLDGQKLFYAKWAIDLQCELTAALDENARLKAQMGELAVGEDEDEATVEKLRAALHIQQITLTRAIAEGRDMQWVRDEIERLSAPPSGEQAAKPKKLTLTEAARIASGKDMQPPSKPIRFAAVPVGNQERRDEEGI